MKDERHNVAGISCLAVITAILAVSSPFGRRTYRVCCECGAEFDYSIETMKINRSERHVVEDMRHAAA